MALWKEHCGITIQLKANWAVLSCNVVYYAIQAGLRSKRLRAFSKQRTRNESQRQAIFFLFSFAFFAYLLWPRAWHRLTRQCNHPLKIKATGHQYFQLLVGRYAARSKQAITHTILLVHHALVAQWSNAYVSAEIFLDWSPSPSACFTASVTARSCIRFAADSQLAMDIDVIVVFLESESRDAEVMEGSLCVSVLQSVVPWTTG